ncbi:MAG: low-specificity L-threonine aldolase [Devosia sp.]
MTSTIRYDFRSDTVTRPDAGMRAAMESAEVGDDVFGDDPTVVRLEAEVAARLGKPAGLFMPSGTQSNLAALMAHCGRGDEYIAGQEAHCYVHEQGGAAVLASIQPQPIAHKPDGSLALSDIEAAIKPDDLHYARTRLLALENTLGGRIIPLSFLREAVGLAKRYGLATHLDGARVFNASVGSSTDVAEIAQGFDSVSVCLSKGLGAPMGSVLVGDREFLDRARRHRKALGGGLRQVGILAAAGLYALERNVARLADDHANAKRLAAGLVDAGLTVTQPDTNIVWVSVPPAVAAEFDAHLAAQGVGITSAYSATQQRWVTHLDVDAAAVDAALAVVRGFLAGRKAA